MNQFRFSFRVGAVLLVIALLMGVFAVRLYDVQVLQSTKQTANDAGTFTYRTRVTAARGEILDRNGNVLIGNRASFNISLVYDVLFSAEHPNEKLRQLTNLAYESGLKIVDHLPITAKKPYEYTTDQFSSIWNGYLKTYLAEQDWDTDISAPQLIRRMMDRYNIPEDWSEDEARRVLSVRYELSLRHCTNLPTYIFVEDVDSATLAKLMELNVPGANVETSTVREYNTNYAAHILGTVGPFGSDEQYEHYKELGYPMDAVIGQSGLEQAFEEQLHGTDGMRETTISEDGSILEEHYLVEPKAGNNVELSIDIGLQKTTEDALRDLIEDLKANGLNEWGSGKDVGGGSAVVMSVKTGEVLACASYPTFNLQTYSDDFADLVANEDTPLVNRALDATYPPGSVFKPCTTIAALQSKAISPDIEIRDEGIYRRFEDQGYLPRCMLWTTAQATHGTLTIQEALQYSCNYFFYEIGYRTGIEAIEQTAKGLGLGEYTGVELHEARGTRASPEAKAANHTGDEALWFGGDTVSAAIGQSEHSYTPIQLCSYMCTLGNKGTRYKATFLRRVISADYQNLLFVNEPVILSQMDITQETYDVFSEGMRLSANKGTACTYLWNIKLGIDICAKTGTAEHGSGGSDNASFVVFAPREDPVIAISVYVERAAGSSNLGKVPRAILIDYFNQSSFADYYPSEYRMN